MSNLGKLTSASAVQAAIDEFICLGRTSFLARYGFGKSRDFLVQDPKTGTQCDSKAIVGPALYILRGPVQTQLYLAPIDYRASFSRVVGAV